MKELLLEGERIDDIGRGMKIIQNSSTPCFSIDAVLLADFAASTAASCCRVIDLGTGTGILPLILSRRMPGADFRAVEIMEVMCSQASRSVDINGLGNRISIIPGDIRHIEDICGRESADLVVCNPPYFRIGHGRSNGDPLFAAARQEISCTLADAVAAAHKVLKSRGHFCLILRAERTAELMALLETGGFACSRLRPVQPYAAENANLVLLEAIKEGRNGITVMPPLIVYESPGIYTKEIMNIYER